MKSSGYIILAALSLFTFTTPSIKIEEIPLNKVELSPVNDSLHKELVLKTDSLEALKAEVIELQTEIGVR